MSVNELSDVGAADDSVSFTGLGIWRYRTETTPPPASGQIRFDNADISIATEFYLSETNDQGSDVSTFMDLLMTSGSVVYIQDRTDADSFVLIELGTFVDDGGSRTFQIASILEGSGGEPTQNTQVTIIVSGTGSGGGGGNVSVVTSPVPADMQVAIWSGPTTIIGDDNFQWDTTLNSGRMEIKCVDNVVNSQGMLMIDPDSVLNPDGWQWVTGQSGIHDGTLILSHKPADVVNNRDVTYLPGGRPTFGFGIAVATDSALGDESAGSLAFFQPRDTSGREETKISFVGFVGGTGHEGVFSVEGYAYSDTGLQFHRLAHFVIDADNTLHFDSYGRMMVGNTALNAAVESGDNCAVGYSQTHGMELTGQGTTNDWVVFDDTHQLSFSKPTGSSGFRLHQRFASTRFTEILQGNPDFSITCEANVTDFLISGYTGVMSIDSPLLVTGAITSGGDISSDTDSTDSLGSTGVRWAAGWFDDITLGGTLAGADATFSTTLGVTGVFTPASYTQLPTFTDTELDAIANAINTDAGKVQGAMVYNATQDIPVYAVGNADADVWVDGAGTTVNTPV